MRRSKVAVQVVAEAESGRPLLVTFYRDDNTAFRYSCSIASSLRLSLVVEKLLHRYGWSIVQRNYEISEINLRLSATYVFLAPYFDQEIRN